MLPVVGASATTKGLYHAFGGSGGGFQIGPAVGDCLANIILGKQPAVPMDAYSISRFSYDVKSSDKLQSEFDSIHLNADARVAEYVKSN